MLKWQRGRMLLVVLLVTTLLASLVAPAGAAPQKPEITILPIDRAKFLVGQQFDFKVEVANLPGDPSSVEVTVNGKQLADFFGKKPQAELAKEMTSVLLRQVSFDAPGSYAVSVTVSGKDWVKNRAVNYQVTRVEAPKPKAKNVILFIGDGMGLPTRTAARILSRGLTEGKYNGLLAMDEMDEYGVVTTSGMDALATDSANSASAYATGHKSAVNAEGVYPDSTKDAFDDPRVENLAELAKRVRGMAVGIVTTSDVTDATPAAMIAHTRRRSESVGILDQFLAFQPDVLLGGGSSWFIPQTATGSKRKDARDVIAEFQQKGYKFAGSATELNNAGTPQKLLGLFHTSNMDVYIDKKITKAGTVSRFPDQPTLMDMTKKAIEVLSQNSNGFFLMVEGASIDKQLHPMDWERAIYDTIEMDQAVAIAKEFAARNQDTLVVVTADHSHGFSIHGTYHELDGKTGRDAVRVYGNAVFPTFEDKDKDGFPDNPAPDVTLATGFANHPDYTDDFKFNQEPLGPAVVKDGKAVPNPVRDPKGTLMTGNLPYGDTTEVHAVDDVPISASGPGASYFNGVIDNTEVFFGMAGALGLDPVRENKALPWYKRLGMAFRQAMSRTKSWTVAMLNL